MKLDMVPQRPHRARLAAGPAHRGRYVALALTLALALASCAKPPAHEAQAERAPVVVTTYRIPAGAASRELVLAAQVRARNEVTIPATVAGRVTALPVAEGRAFRSGDVLVRFDAPEAERALEAARAAERSAAFRHDEALRQEGRIDSLYRTRVASKRELEMAQSDAHAAEAAYQRASAELAATQTGVAVPAPFAGVMGRHLVDAGATVQPGTPLVAVRSTGAIEIELAVPESQIEAVRGADATFQVGGGAWHPAKLSRIEGMIDPTSRTRVAYFTPQTRERFEAGAFARVRFVDAGPQRFDEAAAAGQVAVGGGSSAGEADRMLSDGSAFAVPASSLVRRGALRGVYVIENDHARLRWVRVGNASNEKVEVLSGLWPGESIALDPKGLEDGQPVTIEP